MAKSKKVKGLMRVLMVMSYKNFPILIRMIGPDVFLWDVVVNNQFYSSYIIMKPGKDKVKLTAGEINEVTKMCYAGAAASVDGILGIKLSDTDAEMVNRFEGARNLDDIEKVIKGELN